MTDINIQRPGTLDVTRTNPRAILYIIGDEVTEESIRFKFTDDDDIANVEKLENGVWNDTGLRLSSSSLSIGRDMRVAAAAGFLETFNPSNVATHQKALLPHLEFDSVEGGTVGHWPFLDVHEEFIVFSNPAGQIIDRTIGQIFNVTQARVLQTGTHLVGTVPATRQVQHSFYRGTDNTGVLFNRFIIPASEFVANQPLIINYEDDFGFEANEDIYVEFVSDLNISLQTDIGGNIITSHLGHILVEVEAITEDILITGDAGIVVSNALSFVTFNVFNYQ